MFPPQSAPSSSYDPGTGQVLVVLCDDHDDDGGDDDEEDGEDDDDDDDDLPKVAVALRDSAVSLLDIQLVEIIVIVVFLTLIMIS